MGKVNKALGSATPYGMDVAMRMGTGQSAADAVKGVARDNIILKLLGPTAMWAGMTFGVLKTMEKIVKESGLLERGLQRISTLQGIENKFEGLYKSAEKAKMKMAELQGMSLNMPFRYDEVAAGAVALERLTKGAYSGAQALQEVGDAAAASGNGFVETAQAVGKLMAAIESGRPLERMMFQMQQTGLMTDELARKLEELEARGQLRIQGPEAIRDMLRSYSGAMAKDMGNLETRKLKKEEASTNFDAAFGKAFTDAQSEALDSSARALQNMTPVAEALGQAMQPIVTVSDSIKHKMVDMTLGTKAAQAGFMALIPVVKGVIGMMAATGLGGIAGHLIGWGGRLVRDRGKTAAALSSAEAAGQSGPRRRAYQAAAELAENLMGDPSATWRAKAGAQGGRAMAWLRFRGERAKEINKAALDRYRQDDNDGGFLGGSGAGRYLATWGRALGGGALGVAKTAARTILTLVNPLYLVGAAALAAGAAFQNYANKMEASIASAQALNTQLSQTVAQIQALAEGAKNTDEWAEAMGRLREEIERIKKLRESGKNDKGEDLSEEEKENLDRGQARASGRYVALQRKGPPRLGVSGDKQRDAIAAQVEAEEARLIQKEELELSQRTGEARAAVADKIAARLQAQLAQVKLSEVEANFSASDDAKRLNAAQAYLAQPGKSMDSWTSFKEEEARRVAEEANAAKALKVAQGGLHEARFGPGVEERNRRSMIVAAEQNVARASQAYMDAGARLARLRADQEQKASLETTLEGRQKAEEVVAEITAKRMRSREYALVQKRGTKEGLSPAEEKELATLRMWVANRSQIEQRLAQVKDPSYRGDGEMLMAGQMALFDSRIAAARSRGEVTDGLERDKELERARIDRYLAEGKDPVKYLDATGRAVRIQSEAMGARVEMRDTLAANQLLLNGDPRGYQAYQDRADLRSELAAARGRGLTEDEGIALWRSNFMAQFAGQLPTIHADSIQSVGGGGGYYAGADPMRAAQDRIAKATELTAQLQKEMLEAIRNGARL